MKVTLEIEDNQEGVALIEFLKQLPFVKLKELSKKETRRRSNIKIDSVFGIWQGREISKDSLRERAWRF